MVFDESEAFDGQNWWHLASSTFYYFGFEVNTWYQYQYQIDQSIEDKIVCLIGKKIGETKFFLDIDSNNIWGNSIKDFSQTKLSLHHWNILMQAMFLPFLLLTMLIFDPGLSGNIATLTLC